MCALRRTKKKKSTKKKPAAANTAPDPREYDDPLDQAYATLDPYEIDVLEVLALLYMPVGLNKVARVLKARGARDGNGKMPAHPSVARAIENLGKLGLIGADKEGRICARNMVERITRRMVAEGRFDATAEIVNEEITITSRWGGYLSFSSKEHVVALVRLALYSRDYEQIERLLNHAFESSLAGEFDVHPVSEVLLNPFDPAWLARFPVEQQANWLTFLLQDLTMDGGDAAPVIAHARGLLDVASPDFQLTMAFCIADIAFQQGRLKEGLAGLGVDLGVYGAMLRARQALATGDPEQALDLYEQCLKYFQKETRKKKFLFSTIDTVFFIVALVGAGESHWPRAIELARRGANDKKLPLRQTCEYWAIFLERESGIIAADSPAFDLWRLNPWEAGRSLVEQFLGALLEFWTERESLVETKLALAHNCRAAAGSGYDWLEYEYCEILQQLDPKTDRYKKRAEALQATHGFQPMSALFKPQEAWERALKALLLAGSSDSGAMSEVKPSRLVWLLSEFEGGWDFEPKEQKRSANGKWTKGRAVSLQRLSEQSRELEFLTERDREMCTQVRVDRDGGYWGRMYAEYYLPQEAILSLVGHPLVFMAETGANVEVVSAKPSLQIAKSKSSYTLSIEPGVPEVDQVLIRREGDTRIVVYEFTPEILRVAEALGSGIRVPASAKEEMAQAIGVVSSRLPVHSDIGIGSDAIPEVEADSTPIAQLLPSGDGLLLHLRVQPLGTGGPLFPPAAGGEVVIAEVDGARVQASRNFAEEKEKSGAVVGACPALAGCETAEGEWSLETPEESLELLVQVEACGQEVRVQWPKGQKYAIRGSADFGQFRAKLNGGHNWFEVSGELRVDGDLLLDMRQLLDLTKDSSSRFVDVGQGQFVALTQAFRKKLEELRSVAEDRDGGLRLHALAAPLVDDLLEQAQAVKTNKKWKELAARLQQARDLDPDIPSTLRATLRDYQIDGYKWLARLAEWGVGACLADDMGLGKTVQILALMLRRATGGPQLVVAPTSVCANWEDEAVRFAPTLNVCRLGVGNREDTVANLGAFDILVCSYGLLQSESAILKEVNWQTIVLDEAQAIKNMATKRSKAAMELEGEFRIVSTGTPIENHLGELWNLFRFINPGFLGSLVYFNERFAAPIEKYGDREASRHLKDLIRPFILRRRKEDVLDELPARTDIVLHVELGEKERAFYEALRIRALEELTDAESDPGRHHVRILAEIMRLRRACCNSRLVDSTAQMPSAKLDVFEAVLDDLLDNRHKALVFSQFVDHLAILRKLLDKKGVPYQYLDGGTPAKARRKAVADFQAGEGDVFLISLKAGGTGLNLTAADYVIHMDPWWNPAVEDQASDRAHRIGQQRPVTVYRLVARDTIEDQITDLHHRKRDLANNLLEGSELAGKVTSEELLALLRNG